ncbi:MAG: redoxin domain-containing protein [Deltaproteobacteria bacterium]|jgi:peroxiredoxin|nr:redoxin domain-containing protein [Deltaproteobacteria bacterium]
MVLLNSKMVPLGTEARDFRLKGVDEKEYTLDSFRDKEILIIIIMCNHCPYVKATIGRLVALQHEYEGRGVQLVGINSNDEINYPEDSFENMKTFARDSGMTFPYLRDETQEVAKNYDAVCTPDIYLYGQERRLLYRGRIDDNWQDESAVTRRDLKCAIDAVVEGGAVSGEQHPAMGCSIKWK